MTAPLKSRPREAVLAIDFGGTKIAVGCADLNGRLLEHHRLPTDPERGASQAVRRALDLAASMQATLTSHDGCRVVAVGAVSPGIVLPDRILLAPNVPGWGDLTLPAAISTALPGLPVAIGNDVHAAALAELRWGQLRQVCNGLYINIGTGVAAATVIGGRLVTGAHRAAGEIGYARAGAGKPTPTLLEEVIGGRSLAERASEATGRPLTTAAAFTDTNAQVVALVDEAIKEFGRHLANFATLLDPERIVIGGGLMNAASRILPPLRHCLAEIVPFPPSLLAGAFPADAALRGATALAADTATHRTPGPASRAGGCGTSPPAAAGASPGQGSTTGESPCTAS